MKLDWKMIKLIRGLNKSQKDNREQWEGWEHKLKQSSTFIHMVLRSMARSHTLLIYLINRKFTKQKGLVSTWLRYAYSNCSETSSRSGSQSRQPLRANQWPRRTLRFSPFQYTGKQCLLIKSTCTNKTVQHFMLLLCSEQMHQMDEGSENFLYITLLL